MNQLDSPDLIDDLRAALLWQTEAGVDECLSEVPQNRFDENAKPVVAAPAVAETAVVSATPTAPSVARVVPAVDENDQSEAITEAGFLAKAANTLAELYKAMEGFDGCVLKKGARKTVFADGNPAARVMFIGDAPGQEEDRAGKPFVGRSGQLFDKMLAAIGLNRSEKDPAKAAYIANLIPWRPVGDRDPSSDEAAMMWAFLARHIELAEPEIIVTLGKISSAALIERPIAITRERGRWISPSRAMGRPLLLTFHPAYLLRNPHEKAKSWRDLMSLRAVLDGAPPPFES
jgi:DNA polymerase